MAFGQSPVKAHTSSRAALAIATLLIGTCCIALISTRFDVTYSLDKHASTKAKSKPEILVQEWDQQIQELEKTESNLAKLKTKLEESRDDSDDVQMPSAEKTEKNQCINKQLAWHMKNVQKRTGLYRDVIGDAFIDEETGKDEYANARNEVALKDGSYRSLAAAEAGLSIMRAYMHATKIVEGGEWLGTKNLLTTNRLAKRQINLLGPSDQQVKMAKYFVEKVKTQFPEFVMKCYITDCKRGEGYYIDRPYLAGHDLEHGDQRKNGHWVPKCVPCTVGVTWSGFTDDKPCAPVLATCPAGSGYEPTTSAALDATCNPCAAGTFSSKQDAESCSPFTVTTCPAGQELTKGDADSDGSCSPCPDGTYKATTGPSKCQIFHTPTCGAGTELVLGTATADSHCVPCKQGTFSVDGGACGPHGSDQCGPGFYHVSGTKTSDHTCLPCKDGYYKDDTSSSACAPITVKTCPAGRELTPGSPTSNGVCNACKPGFEKTTSGPGPCVASDFVYVGCFSHSSQDAVTFHDYHHKGGGDNWSGCMQQAKAAGSDWFALEYPQGYSHPGYASCGWGGNYKLDGAASGCDAEVDPQGHKLGSAFRMAIYRRPGTQ